MKLPAPTLLEFLTPAHRGSADFWTRIAVADEWTEKTEEVAIILIGDAEARRAHFRCRRKPRNIAPFRDSVLAFPAVRAGLFVTGGENSRRHGSRKQ